MSHFRFLFLQKITSLPWCLIEVLLLASLQADEHLPYWFYNMNYTALCTLNAATCAFLKSIFTEHAIKEPLGEKENRLTEVWSIPIQYEGISYGNLQHCAIWPTGKAQAIHAPSYELIWINSDLSTLLSVCQFSSQKEKAASVEAETQNHKFWLNFVMWNLCDKASNVFSVFK